MTWYRPREVNELEQTRRSSNADFPFLPGNSVAGGTVPRTTTKRESHRRQLATAATSRHPLTAMPVGNSDVCYHPDCCRPGRGAPEESGLGVCADGENEERKMTTKGSFTLVDT